MDGIPPHEPLILWKPPEGSPEHWKPVMVDPIMCHRLRPHQREGVQFCFDCIAGLKKFNGAGCILADDMGLGKTFQSIVLIWTALKQGLPPSVEGSGYVPPPPETNDPQAAKQAGKKAKKAKKASKPEQHLVEVVEDPDDVIQLSSDSDSDDDFAEAKQDAGSLPATMPMTVDEDPQPEDSVASEATGAAANALHSSAQGALGPTSPLEPIASDRSTEQQEPMAKKVIVVCPTSLIGNWDN